MEDDLEIRDLYAMFAMAGCLGSPRLQLPLDCDAVAVNAYEMADAMLKARQPATSGLPSIKRKPRK